MKGVIVYSYWKRCLLWIYSYPSAKTTFYGLREFLFHPSVIPQTTHHYSDQEMHFITNKV